MEASRWTGSWAWRSQSKTTKAAAAAFRIVREKLTASARVLEHVHDVVLEDEQVRLAIAREADHALVVVLDPAADNLAIEQLHRDRRLLFAQGFQVLRLLPGLVRGRHLRLVHGAARGQRIRGTE